MFKRISLPTESYEASKLIQFVKNHLKYSPSRGALYLLFKSGLVKGYHLRRFLKGCLIGQCCTALF